jgi:hypothetical protein
MNFLIEIVFPGVFLVILLAFMIGAGCAGWAALPDTKRESLQRALMRIRGKEASSRSGPPIYAVQADGHLLYASGKEDVQAFLGTTMHVASRQILQLVDEGHPATILLTCGSETILIDVHMPE